MVPIYLYYLAISYSLLPSATAPMAKSDILRYSREEFIPPTPGNGTPPIPPPITTTTHSTVPKQKRADSAISGRRIGKFIYYYNILFYFPSTI